MAWRKPSSKAKWKACEEDEDQVERGTLTSRSGLDANYTSSIPDDRTL